MGYPAERKEKALVETAALLVMRQKLQAIWPDEPGEDAWSLAQIAPLVVDLIDEAVTAADRCPSASGVC